MPECSHENKRIVETHLGVQGEPMRIKQLRYQCQECGGLSYNAVSREKAGWSIPQVDEAALRTKLQADELVWQQDLESRYAKMVARASTFAQDRREEYQEYLCSPEWRRRRDLVLSRAHGVCEGCREREASEVHHLTYQNIGNEFLWELVAVCRGCHERVHQIRK
jgi:hypothetical protein